MQRNEYFAQVFKMKCDKWCKKNKLKHSDLSKTIGVHPNMITRYKQGVSYPTEEVLEKICSIFNCQKEEFIPNIQDMKSLSEYTGTELFNELRRRYGNIVKMATTDELLEEIKRRIEAS